VAEGIGLLNQRAVDCTMGSNPISSERWYIEYFFKQRECSSIGRTHALQA
jgi:hypothetical protein